MEPFFSVIIPTFNNAHIIGKTIKSVLNQSFTNFEIIIIDDGSTDNTSETIDAINDNRITYKKIKNFGGPSRPRNIGVSLSKSNWICFLDSDDLWKFNKLEVCYNNINIDVDLIYHDMKIVGSTYLKQNRYIKARKLTSPIVNDLLINGNCIANSSVVVRKSMLYKVGSINESKEMIAAEDFNTWLKIARISEKFIHIPLVLGDYLEHSNGISKADVYSPYKASTLEFINLLNKKEYHNFKLNLESLKIKKNIIDGTFTLFNLDFNKFLFNKKFSFKIKFKYYVLCLIITKNKIIKKYF